MKNHLHDIARKHLKIDYDALPEREKRVVERHGERLPISRNVNREFDDKTTFGQRLADRVAAFGGSWTFIIIFFAALLIWVLVNSLVFARRVDSENPDPYLLLNLVLSMLAAIQAPIILMSQNRRAEKDRLAAAHDYEVNLKAEIEILSLHEKLDELRTNMSKELISMQQEQRRLLAQLLNGRSPVKKDA